MNGLSPNCPGVKRTHAQSSLPSNAPFINLGINPAHTKDDLPEPDAPTTAMNRWSGSRNRDSSSSVSRPLPKKMGESLTVKGRKPGKGEPVQKGSAIAFGSMLLDCSSFQSLPLSGVCSSNSLQTISSNCISNRLANSLAPPWYSLMAMPRSRQFRMKTSTCSKSSMCLSIEVLFSSFILSGSSSLR